MMEMWGQRGTEQLVLDPTQAWEEAGQGGTGQALALLEFLVS